MIKGGGGGMRLLADLRYTENINVSVCLPVVLSICIF